MTDQPRKKEAIIKQAMDAGLTYNGATKLFRLAFGAGAFFEWPTGDRRKREYANQKPPIGG